MLTPWSGLVFVISAGVFHGIELSEPHHQSESV